MRSVPRTRPRRHWRTEGTRDDDCRGCWSAGRAPGPRAEHAVFVAAERPRAVAVVPVHGSASRGQRRGRGAQSRNAPSARTGTCASASTSRRAFALLVLDRCDWPHFADLATYGISHFTPADNLVVGAEPADAWHDIARELSRRLPAPAVRALIKVHGARSPACRRARPRRVAESLVAHDLARLIADRAGASFPAPWMRHAFANYALVAVLGETDPAGLHRLGTLAEAAAALAAQTPDVAALDAAERPGAVRRGARATRAHPNCLCGVRGPARRAARALVRLRVPEVRIADHPRCRSRARPDARARDSFRARRLIRKSFTPRGHFMSTLCNIARRRAFRRRGLRDLPRRCRAGQQGRSRARPLHREDRRLQRLPHAQLAAERGQGSGKGLAGR